MVEVCSGFVFWSILVFVLSLLFSIIVFLWFVWDEDDGSNKWPPQLVLNISLRIHFTLFTSCTCFSLCKCEKGGPLPADMVPF